MPHTVCNNECTRKNGFLPFSRYNGYKNGFRYCSVCNKWIKSEAFVCKCCGGRLRTSPRGRTK